MSEARGTAGTGSAFPDRIDLAGRHEPQQTPAHEVRILRAVTWPRMTLSYRLEQDGSSSRRPKKPSGT